MALAPLSQTLLLTEDGSVAPVTAQVTIPPFIPVSLPATIVTPADITDDGSPKVGETLTGVDPVIRNGSISRRRWLSGSTVIQDAAAYTPSMPGTVRWSVDVLGDNGVTVETGSTVVIAAATLANTLATTSLKGSQVAGFEAALVEIDARITALGGLTENVSIDMERTLDLVIADIRALLDELEGRPPAPVISYDLSFDGPASPVAPVPQSAFIFSGLSSITEGTPTGVLSAFALSGPTTIAEGNPPAGVSAFAFTGPSTITEGNASTAVSAFVFSGATTIAEGTLSSFKFTGPATITEGN